MPNGVALGPVFRMTVLQMVCGATYSRFQNFAQRFCTRCQQLVETSPTRHPEVFPVSFREIIYPVLTNFFLKISVSLLLHAIASCKLFYQVGCLSGLALYRPEC